jgi:hypothetical protein
VRTVDCSMQAVVETVEAGAHIRRPLLRKKSDRLPPSRRNTAVPYCQARLVLVLVSCSYTTYLQCFVGSLQYSENIKINLKHRLCIIRMDR